MNNTRVPNRPAVDGLALHDLARRASFLWERLAAPTSSLTAADRRDDTAVRQRIQRWSARLRPLNLPDDEAISKRLAWDGLDAAVVSSCLADDCDSPYDRLPNWAHTMAAISEGARAWHASGGAARGPVSGGLPFEQLFEPIRLLGRQRLAERLARSGRAMLHDRMSAACAEQLERALMSRLAATSAKALMHEFSSGLPLGEQLLRRLAAPALNAGSTHFQRFVDSTLQDGFATLFDRYPVLARLLATLLDGWVETTACLVERLTADYPLLQETFSSPSASLGQVATLQLALSDAHRGGSSTVVLRFDSGIRLLYKPKSLALDVAYNRLLQWCNDERALLPLQTTHVLDRDDYGWCAFVSHRACTDRASVAHFYRRAGMLACLLHLLRGTDCHFENLIADGEHPVLVDTETLLHPEPQAMDEIAGTTTEHAQQILNDSVLRTGLLPRWDFSPDRRTAFDTSGLTRLDDAHTLGRSVVWHAVNTDAMTLRVQPMAPPQAANAPHCADAETRPEDFRAELLAGFEAMYGFLRTRRTELLAEGGPLAALRALPVRYVFRATRHYVGILQHGLQAEALRNGADFAIELERLACGYLSAGQRPHAWPQLRAELQALGQLDIPFFHTTTESTVLGGDQGLMIPGYFRNSGWADLQRQFGRWNDADLALQRSVMNGCFDARMARSGNDNDSTVLSTAPPRPEAEDWIAAAERIADELMARAVEIENGAPQWIGLQYVHEADRFQLQVADHSLYEGHVGIALFLAALQSLRPDERRSAYVQRMLQPLVRQIGAAPGHAQTLSRQAGIGIGSGSGGVIYGLTRISQWLRQPVWLEQATTLALAITPDIVAKDRSLDVIGGAAGAILGLLALHGATGDARVLQPALACGRHLLAERRGAPGEPRAWPLGPDRRPNTGMAHGAAGISLALMRLHQATGEAAFRSAALEGMAFERGLYDPDKGNWPDAAHGRAPAAGDFRVQWCRGAPGIALARLGASFGPPAAEDHTEVVAAIETTLRAGPAGRDHLCCGTSGRVETLLVAAEALDRADWAAAAHQAAAAMLVRAQDAGGYRLAAQLGAPLFNPGLFQGTAGIGYQWLRLACPSLPSVLLWQ